MMVPSNALQRTFRVRFGNALGTCFTADIDGRQYLVTARHVVEGIQADDQVEIMQNGQWHPLPVRLVGLGEGTADVGVLAATRQLSPTYPCPLSSENVFLSQDVYFLGYPYGLSVEVGPTLNAGFPLPLVKKAIISSMVFANGNEMATLLLDGHNNPGFSGGPVIAPMPGSREVQAIGVISGYRHQWEPVFMQGAPTPLEFRYNTGIVIATGARPVRKIILANPIGFVLPAGD